MSNPILYGLPPSTYVRTARLALELKGVAYDLEPVEFRSESHRRLHPFSRIPALRHADLELYETLAITTYVDEAFDGLALQPADPGTRAQMMQWISVINGYAYDAMVTRCVAERFVKPMRGLPTDDAVIADALPDITYQLDLFDRCLSQTPWLAGDQMSLADLFLGPIMVYFAATPEGQSTLPDRPDVTRWLAALNGNPIFAALNTMGG